MNLSELRGLIQEFLTTADDPGTLDHLDHKDLHNTIKHDIHYLKDFKFKKFGKDGKGTYKWVFEFVTHDKSYIIDCAIINNKNKWYATVDIFWKNKTDKTTSDSGKDIDKKFGGFNSYEELVKELNHKLNNNLTMSAHIYEDDYIHNLNKEIVELLKKLRENGEELVKSNHAAFKKIIDTYHKIKHITDEGGLYKFADNEWKDEADKGTAILELQKADWDDFYKDMEKMGHV